MKSKAFFLIVLLIVGSWFVLDVIQILCQHQISERRLKQTSFIRIDIEKIKKSINKNIDESISKKDLLNFIEIARLEGRITELNIEDAIDQSKRHKGTIPDFIPLILLAAILMKIGAIEKKYKMNLS